MIGAIMDLGLGIFVDDVTCSRRGDDVSGRFLRTR